MRYIMLIYSSAPERELSERSYNAHWTLMEEAEKKGAFVAAEPLPPTAVTRTVRPGESGAMITDGPFAETKEQLAGFYIFDCQSEDEALEWAQKILPACTSASAVEVRPLPGVPARKAESVGASLSFTTEILRHGEKLETRRNGVSGGEGEASSHLDRPVVC